MIKNFRALAIANTIDVSTNRVYYWFKRQRQKTGQFTRNTPGRTPTRISETISDQQLGILEKYLTRHPNFTPQQAAELGSEIGLSFETVFEWQKKKTNKPRTTAAEEFASMNEDKKRLLKRYIRLSSNSRAGLTLDERLELADDFEINVKDEKCKEAVNWLSRMKQVVKAMDS